MRQFAIGLLTGLAALLGLSSTAHAAATLDLIFSGTTGSGTPGGTSIQAAVGDTLTLDLVLTAGTEGLSSWGISIEFDNDGLNELDLVGQTEFGIIPTVTCTPFPACFFNSPNMPNLSPGVAGTAESTTGLGGGVFTFEAATLGNGVSASFGSFTIGTVTFTVTGNVATDGVDIISGLLSPGADGVFTNAGLPAVVTFGSAAVNGPEPGTAILLGLGLLGLTLAGRRNRS